MLLFSRVALLGGFGILVRGHGGVEVGHFRFNHELDLLVGDLGLRVHGRRLFCEGGWLWLLVGGVLVLVAELVLVCELAE